MEKDKKTTKSINDEHIIMVDNKESVDIKNDELTDRINRLYGVSSEPEKEKKNYDPKELEEVRKKLIFLLMGVVLCGIVVVFILFNPFKFDTKNTSSEIKENDNLKQEVSEEIPLGEIELTNTKVEELNRLISFNINDSMEIDLFPLYSTEVVNINDFPNDIKLYLLKRSTLFLSLLEKNNIGEYVKTCDANGLLISKKDFDDILKKIYGPDVLIKYNSINYSYYGKERINRLTLNYTEEGYIVKCNEFAINTNLVKYVGQQLIKAVKTENSIEIYHRTVFVNETGVYKDPGFTSLITNDINAKTDDYMPLGEEYKYTFIEDNNSFYLSKIEKVQKTS